MTLHVLSFALQSVYVGLLCIIVTLAYPQTSAEYISMVAVATCSCHFSTCSTTVVILLASSKLSKSSLSSDKVASITCGWIRFANSTLFTSKLAIPHSVNGCPATNKMLSCIPCSRLASATVHTQVLKCIYIH